MSVALSPDGRTIATDMQGSIWTMPAAGGAMTRVTDVFNDARQPMWSPDGGTITFFAYRDGGYDIWSINADGGNQKKLTWGAFDDREPIWSHDGTRVAFSSDRGNSLGSDYNIWILDTRNGEFRQITKGASEDFMPTLVARRQRDRLRLVPRQLRIAVEHARAQRRRAPSAIGQGRAPRCAVVGPRRPVALSRHRGRADPPARSRAKPVTGDENVFAFRASWASSTEFLYVSDGKIRRRSIAGLPMQTIEFTATMPVTPAASQYTRRARDFTSTTPRKTLGIVRPVISPDGTQIAFAAVGDIYVMPTNGGAATNLTKDAALDTDPAWSPDGEVAGLFIRQGQRASAAVDSRHGERPGAQGHQPDDAAAGRVVLAGRQAHRVLQRRRHVARRRNVDPRSSTPAR